jgi:hypothetical protein
LLPSGVLSDETGQVRNYNTVARGGANRFMALERKVRHRTTSAGAVLRYQPSNMIFYSSALRAAPLRTMQAHTIISPGALLGETTIR